MNSVVYLLLGVIIGMCLMYYLVYKFPLEFNKISNTIYKAKIKNSEGVDVMQVATDNPEEKKETFFSKIFKKKNESKDESEEDETNSETEES